MNENEQFVGKGLSKSWIVVNPDCKVEDLPQDQSQILNDSDTESISIISESSSCEEEFVPVTPVTQDTIVHRTDQTEVISNDTDGSLVSSASDDIQELTTIAGELGETERIEVIIQVALSALCCVVLLGISLFVHAYLEGSASVDNFDSNTPYDSPEDFSSISYCVQSNHLDETDALKERVKNRYGYDKRQKEYYEVTSKKNKGQKAKNGEDLYNQKLEELRIKEEYLKEKEKFLIKKEHDLLKREMRLMKTDDTVRKQHKSKKTQKADGKVRGQDKSKKTQNDKKARKPYQYGNNFSKFAENEQKPNMTGQWYIKLHEARNNMRQKEHASDWVFDRAQLRSLKRNKIPVKEHWYYP